MLDDQAFRSFLCSLRNFLCHWVARKKKNQKEKEKVLLMFVKYHNITVANQILNCISMVIYTYGTQAHWNSKSSIHVRVPILCSLLQSPSKWRVELIIPALDITAWKQTWSMGLHKQCLNWLLVVMTMIPSYFNSLATNLSSVVIDTSHLCVKPVSLPHPYRIWAL